MDVIFSEYQIIPCGLGTMSDEWYAKNTLVRYYFKGYIEIQCHNLLWIEDQETRLLN